MTSEQVQTLPQLTEGVFKDEVATLKSLLRSQGGWDGTTSKQFGPKLKEAVRYFQSTHIGSDGKFLESDGVVGPDTWWALYNPSGSAQKSGIVPPKEEDPHSAYERRYGRLSTHRRAFISAAFSEHAKNVHEIPDGSNQGGEVDKYIKGFGPAPWCALFVNWLFFLVEGRYPNNVRQAHVQTGIAEAKRAGRFFKRGHHDPAPGDLGVWAFPGGSGHVSVCVAVSEDSERLNTIGGNEGNRVKLGLRTLDDEPSLAGFIDLFGDSETAMFARGLLKAGESGALTSET